MPYDGARPPKLLTAEEEVVLAKQVHAGRDGVAGRGRSNAEQAAAARRRLIESNLGLAIGMARKFPAPSHVDREDMVQDAMIGLDRAVELFDWRKGYRFSTYASWWIRHAIQGGLENTAAPVRIPAQRRQELNAMLHEVGGSVHELSPKLAATYAVSAMASLDRPIGGDSDGEGMGAALAAVDPDPVDCVITAQQRRLARDLVASLDDASRYVVCRRFGFDGHEPATFTELGTEFGVSAEAVRRRVQRVLKRLEPLALATAA